jgi:hypothetical protein
MLLCVQSLLVLRLIDEIHIFLFENVVCLSLKNGELTYSMFLSSAYHITGIYNMLHRQLK